MEPKGSSLPARSEQDRERQRQTREQSLNKQLLSLVVHLSGRRLLTKPRYNTIVVSMVPAFIDLAGSPWPVLPPGIHLGTLSEVEERFATNPGRRGQFRGLIAALISLRGAGCIRVFLDGSYMTAKPSPNDFDACWDPEGVNPAFLDPILLTFDNNRAAQKAKYKGEFFPSTIPADAVGTIFIEFFQVDRFTGARKGIVAIDLLAEPILQPAVVS